MKAMVDELRAYFASTPKEQIKREWEEVLNENNTGPSIEDFIMIHDNPYWNLEKITTKNPEFTSDFFIIFAVN